MHKVFSSDRLKAQSFEKNEPECTSLLNQTGVARELGPSVRQRFRIDSLSMIFLEDEIVID